MDAVRGLAADAVWRLPLTASARATVESSFEHAVNLELDETLLTLVTVSGRPAPGALVTDAECFPRLPVGTDVEIRAGRARIGSLRVDAVDCHFFSCDAVPVLPPLVSIDPACWWGALLEQSVPGSFVPTSAPSPFDRALHRRLISAAQHYQHGLGAALSGRDVDRLEAAVSELVGLGVGLTPSGDDYLVGSLAALHHLGTTGPVVSVLGGAVAAQASRTTTLSRHFLSAAAGGRFHHDVRWAATAALTAPAEVAAAFSRVAAIGSTSGTDVLHGLVDTLSTCFVPTHPVSSETKEIVT